MKIIAIDIQGFQIFEEWDEKWGFYAKEVCITTGDKSNNYLFKSPIQHHDLSEKSKKQVSYETKKIHGIPYTKGNIEYSEIGSILSQDLNDGDIVYVKGEQKKQFVEKSTWVNIKVVNIEHLNWPTPLPMLGGGEKVSCFNHNHWCGEQGERQLHYRCASTNAMEILKWLEKNILTTVE